MAAEPQVANYAKTFQDLLRVFEVPRHFRVGGRTLHVQARPKPLYGFAPRYAVNELLVVTPNRNEHLTIAVSFDATKQLIQIQPNWIWRTIGPAEIAPSVRHREVLVAILRKCLQDTIWLEQNPGKSLRPAEKVMHDIRSAIPR